MKYFRTLSNGIVSLLMLLLAFSSCQQKKEADSILFNGKIYTVDSTFKTCSAIAIIGGQIASVGSDESILKEFQSKNTKDLHGLAVYPGFIDSHCHFLHYGLGLNEVDLTSTTSFEDVLARLKTQGRPSESGWITGRGWDQNDWPNTSFPTNRMLDSLYPNTAILLKRIDGHAALANSEALRRGGINAQTHIDGGDLLRNGNTLTGVLIDNAIDLVEKVIPAYTETQMSKGLTLAQEKCFAVGLTTVDDAGLTSREVDIIKSMHAAGSLKMRIYGMLTANEENEKQYYSKPNTILKTDRLNIRSVKLYADGALGSRGACLLAHYDDEPTKQGFLLQPIAKLEQIAQLCADHGYQLNTHSIGDSANRLMLGIYEKYAHKGNNLRWRIEHAQVVNEVDFDRFGKSDIIPSVQPTHATSDMYWASARVGPERMKGAYAYKRLLDENKMIALGTDFPIEGINPMNTFYAAVVRKDLKNFPAEGFQTENKLSREEALRGMTIWAAYANFEDHEKGSLEVGKEADLVILDQDLMMVADSLLPKLRVLQTYVHGELVFQTETPK